MNKRKQAEKILTKAERDSKTPPFNGKTWTERREQRMKKSGFTGNVHPAWIGIAN